MKELQPYVASTSCKSPKITRKDVRLPGARCWVLGDFLSRTECEHYVDEAEKLGYESIETMYPKDYRDCVRVGSYFTLTLAETSVDVCFSTTKWVLNISSGQKRDSLGAAMGSPRTSSTAPRH